MGGCLVVAIIVGMGLVYRQQIERALIVATLFQGFEQYENFDRLEEIFPVATLPPSNNPNIFPSGEPTELPAKFRYQAKTLNTAEFLSETDTSALLVLRDGLLAYENYWLTGGRETAWLSMSVAKSFISALIGIAIEEGSIQSVADSVLDYAPELEGSAYDGVTLKDVLQMSSGASWNEDYSDPMSDINRFARIFALGGSLTDFTATLQRKNPPGTYHSYNSMDTQVLALILVNATGRSITDYMAEKLWEPMGAEYRAHWLLDSDGMEMAFGGLNATARDYAKLGELYRGGGSLNGRRVVPADWVSDSLRPDSQHLLPGENNPASSSSFGYGYQWWIPTGDSGEFLAIGVYNQFIYVDPSKNAVIVKLSANSEYGTSADESSYRELETLELFRAIASDL
ncbi:MAG: serine hydrolase [Congregibacter sp.]